MNADIRLLAFPFGQASPVSLCRPQYSCFPLRAGFACFVMQSVVFLLSPSGILAGLPFKGNPGKQSGERMRAERGREETKKDKFKIFVNQSDITEDVKKSV